MSELRFETISIAGAQVGKANPLPAIKPLWISENKLKIHSSVPEEDAKYVGFGCEPQCLPYCFQDGYNREKKQRQLKVAVLENEILRAEFYLELGGRLRSLLHKPSGRELLYVNSVFQPANLAIRNAWFSGGVEWNIGLPGHTPLTCEPLFAARAKFADGTPVLRMYEYERIRGVTYQMDFYLPDKSPVLLARISIFNPNDHEVPMYWWSNIAVPEKEDVRVLVPAEEAFNFGLEYEMKLIKVPYYNGGDLSYPTKLAYAADYFYKIRRGQRPWITALDEAGTGLFQTSTDRLCTRKLFVWGMNPGGRKWQEFLAEPGQRYCEIQAGIARTQAECIPMPGRTQWCWLEAYGMLEADAATVHSSDWGMACKEVDNKIEGVVKRAWMDAQLESSGEMAQHRPEEIIQSGTGWGALEIKRRKRLGLSNLCGESMIFDEGSMSAEQQPWLELLENGTFPTCEPGKAPVSFMIDEGWRKLLLEAVHNKQSDHWYTWYHLGIFAYHAKEFAAAQYAWQTSIELKPSAWAYRNLAIIAKDQNRLGDCGELYLHAVKLAPDVKQLVTECCQALIGAQMWKQLIALFKTMPAEMRRHGRIQLCEAQLAFQFGDYKTAKRILSDLVLPDIREGEVTLGKMWYTIHEKILLESEGAPADGDIRRRVKELFPLPKDLNFGMSSESEMPGAPVSEGCK